MKKSALGVKSVVILLLLVIAGAAGFGYVSQSTTLKEENPTPATQTPLTADAVIFKPAAGDIILGNADAPVTIYDYSSLTCPHCAHFHTEVLPQLKKEFLDSGKAKLVFRHFPLNEPALRASQIVQCADETQRATFIDTFFRMQAQWAFSATFLDDLKRIAAVGGIDSAAFDTCIADKAGENAILETRKVAAEIGHVDSTPSFFIGTQLLAGDTEIESFRKAIATATPAPAAQSK